MRHSTSIIPQFFVTASQECPYLEHQNERKLFTPIIKKNGDLINNTLSKQGFRRSQNVLYRPACTDCVACLSARISTKKFIISRSQKRLLKSNKYIFREYSQPKANMEQFNLFTKYIDTRHKEGGMSGMDYSEYKSMVEETYVNTRLMHYRNKEGELLGICLTDILDDGLSMVYSFYNPCTKYKSLGTYMILDHIKFAQETKQDYVYLGYWVKGSLKMNYKASFSGTEVFAKKNWVPLKTFSNKVGEQNISTVDPVSKQISQIKFE
ncbi:MAG: arginyltransferase [Paracoccaceae bacterium]